VHTMSEGLHSDDRRMNQRGMRDLYELRNVEDVGGSGRTPARSQALCRIGLGPTKPQDSKNQKIHRVVAWARGEEVNGFGSNSTLLRRRLGNILRSIVIKSLRLAANLGLKFLHQAIEGRIDKEPIERPAIVIRDADAFD
jgi:hypothetical protein